jgi:hypothetical protein
MKSRLCNQVLAIVRIRQWGVRPASPQDSQTTDYQRIGWTQRNSRAVDARIVRVLSFEKAFSSLSTELQHGHTILKP